MFFYFIPGVDQCLTHPQNYKPHKLVISLRTGALGRDSYALARGGELMDPE